MTIENFTKTRNVSADHLFNFNPPVKTQIRVHKSDEITKGLKKKVRKKELTFSVEFNGLDSNTQFGEELLHFDAERAIAFAANRINTVSSGDLSYKREREMNQEDGKRET